ncbi:MAG: tyrosine-protein phosphatase [Clostridia bacterium]|nr:tyrosine-protein phosphatase [Clostridia bacterium]
MTELLSPKNGARVQIMSGAIREFIKKTRDGTLADGLDDRGWDQIYSWIPEERDPMKDLTAPAHVLFKWRCTDPAAPAALEISEYPDFSFPSRLTKGRICGLATEEDVFFSDVCNLKTGARYFWRVTGPGGSDEVFSFTTEEGVRTIEIPGCSNVRDIGGCRNADGVRIRQGLVYRGCATDPHEEERYLITGEGKRIFLYDLGIKTQLDLRGDVGPSEFAPDDPVNVIKIPYDSYRHSEKECAGLTREIFGLLSDPSVYPVYINCQAGADRTGTVIYYLKALLGVAIDDIVLDFNISSLSAIDQRYWGTSSNVKGHAAELAKDFRDVPFAEALVLRLFSLGVTEEEAEKIREILLEQ